MGWPVMIPATNNPDDAFERYVAVQLDIARTIRWALTELEATRPQPADDAAQLESFHPQGMTED